ncbi:hypothetical protein G7085_09400 [Tessaracoccus sp. HDW20]|uniref:glycoside hydrolase N-terminal domain-containing protein n=1 Tax=Tessaracoccus coleopterorum TaxID=2714950 RepID=UPI0018D2A597|nr:glycoside hydrolase N-terminal domain-containing protein [Tessaracoccus coleopterorum]NHB84750.1 hypothetical protein [Tessaracoccus coleopterorum]
MDDKSTHVFGMPFEESSGHLVHEIIDPAAWRDGMGMYQDLGDLRLDFWRQPLTGVSDYVRELAIDTGVATVSYRSDGVSHTREMFTSHPDNVLAARLSTDAPGAVSVHITLTGAQAGAVVVADGSTVTLSGELADNQLRYEAQVGWSSTAVRSPPTPPASGSRQPTASRSSSPPAPTTPMTTPPTAGRIRTAGGGPGEGRGREGLRRGAGHPCGRPQRPLLARRPGPRRSCRHPDR